MNINSIQNVNNTRPNFGCGICKVTEELLSQYGQTEVHNILRDINPKDPLEPITCQALKRFGISRDKLHLMRADAIHAGFVLIDHAGGLDKIIPERLRSLVKAFKDEADDAIQIRIGEDF